MESKRVGKRTVKLKNNQQSCGIEISKKGGWLVGLENDRNVKGIICICVAAFDIFLFGSQRRI